MTYIIALWWLVFLAKPLYWTGKFLYLAFKGHPDHTVYFLKVGGWLMNVWECIRWQKEDM